MPFLFAMPILSNILSIDNNKYLSYNHSWKFVSDLVQGI